MLREVIREKHNSQVISDTMQCYYTEKTHRYARPVMKVSSEHGIINHRFGWQRYSYHNAQDSTGHCSEDVLPRYV